ncbi:MAG: molybdopterin-dependent oxidoreductase [Myxococcota bacterium]
MNGPIRTTCPYCGVGCGVIARRGPKGDVVLKGDPAHPANHGQLCSKGTALGDTLGLEGRLLYPEIDGARATWEESLDLVASKFAEVIARRGPNAAAFYVSGQLLTEDYYITNKLMKGFIGSGNIDTNSRLCMASTVAGHIRAFGADAVPCCYEDLEAAKLVVLTGSNAAWCHPILFQRIKAAKRKDPDKKVVVIDPRRTATCELADLHLPIRPGADAILWNGLLDWLQSRGVVDYAFLEEHTKGFGRALAAAKTREGIPRVAASCGLLAEDLVRFYEWWARDERVVTVFSQGINQSTSGSDKVSAILNCHLLTGRIGKPGSGPFSFTGQPNAMGGREVGGLANTLAAHMGFTPENVDRVGRFWKSDRVASKPGLKAVDLFERVLDGEVEALWIACTNPAVSLPNTSRVRDALAKVPFLVVSDCMRTTDTTRHAHVLLPALTWGEKDGTVTNTERCISRQRAFLDAPGEARPDWKIFCDVARRMGFEGFDFTSPKEIFAEHAALSAFENNGTRDFDIGGLVDAYDSLEPVRWPAPEDNAAGTKRLFADGRFYTDDGRANFVAVSPRPPAYVPDVEFDLVLNTGRVRDHWHTMTRTAKSPGLASHLPEPYVEMHPSDAADRGLSDRQLVRIETPWGEMVARIKAFEGQRRGSVFVPFHWTGEYARLGRVGPLISSETDPTSGQPEFKHTPARVIAYAPAWHGFLLLRGEGSAPCSDYWVRVPGDGFTQFDLAGDHRPETWASLGRKLLGSVGGTARPLEFHDEARGRYRAAFVEEGRLVACLFVASSDDLPPRRWLQGLFHSDSLSDVERMGLLAGRPASGHEDDGPIVCTCFGVGLNVLVRAIRREGLASPEAIGAALNAGTNCGSCVPEVEALLDEHRAA